MMDTKLYYKVNIKIHKAQLEALRALFTQMIKEDASNDELSMVKTQIDAEYNWVTYYTAALKTAEGKGTLKCEICNESIDTGREEKDVLRVTEDGKVVCLDCHLNHYVLEEVKEG